MEIEIAGQRGEMMLAGVCSAWAGMTATAGTGAEIGTSAAGLMEGPTEATGGGRARVPGSAGTSKRRCFVTMLDDTSIARVCRLVHVSFVNGSKASFATLRIHLCRVPAAW